MFVATTAGVSQNFGAMYAFGPWITVGLDPIIVVSVDKAMQLVKLSATYWVWTSLFDAAAGGANLADEKVDYLDGFNLADVAANKVKRDYIVGESITLLQVRLRRFAQRFLCSQ